MKYIKYLREYKNIGPLYHIVDLEKLSFILDNNIIKPKHFFNGISTTRNKSMNSYLGDKYSSIFKLEMDAGLLSHNYKIKPFSASYTEIGRYSSKKKQFEEFEEVIKTREIKDAKKYINKIIIIKDKVESAVNTAWFDSDGGYFNNERITYPEYFKRYILNCDIPIYVQDVNKIIKDDEWVNKIANHPIKEINHAYVYYNKEDREHPKFKGATKPYYIPTDDHNKEIEDYPVIGTKSDIYIERNGLNKGQYKFDYVYDLDKIAAKTDDYIFIRNAKLNNVVKL